MTYNAEYNSGRPYFIAFRPLLHSTRSLSKDELGKYKKYFEETDDMDYQTEEMKKAGVDVLDAEMELRLAKTKVQQGQFQMAEMYLEGLRPRISDLWAKAGKEPMHKARKKVSKEEILAGIMKAKMEREKYVKGNKGEEAKVEGNGQPKEPLSLDEFEKLNMIDKDAFTDKK